MIRFCRYRSARCAAFLVTTSMACWSATSWGAPPERRSSLHSILVEQGYVMIPLHRAGTGHIQLRAAVNGQPVRLILDTGAPTAVLDRKRCENLGLPIVRKGVSANGIGASGITADVASVRLLQLGNVDLRNVAVAVTDLSVVNQQVPDTEEADGILGADILTKAKAVIDCDALRMYVKATASEKR